jgi:hypothetical protein
MGHQQDLGTQYSIIACNFSTCCVNLKGIAVVHDFNQCCLYSWEYFTEERTDVMLQVAFVM